MVENNKIDMQINASKNLFANLHFFSAKHRLPCFFSTEQEQN